jgi:hypothetical protein
LDTIEKKSTGNGEWEMTDEWLGKYSKLWQVTFPKEQF